jgi:hypothetical protein
MKYTKIKVGFDAYTDSDFLTFAKHVSQMMTGNTNFTTPSPCLASINTAITDYETALGKAVNGSKTDTATKSQKRLSLTLLLQQLGYYVQTTANNDLAKALSSGFETVKDRTPNAVPNPPKSVTVKQGIHSGEAIVDCNREPSAVTYLCRYTLNIATPVWVSLPPQTSHKFTITGLAKGKDVWACIAALNSAGTSDWSDIASATII